jgi:RNA polymerase sigma-70 factor (ECF subfamily)
MEKQQKFVQVIKENEGIIFKITFVYAQNSEEQKDLYQDIVYQLWKSFDSFKNESKISTWLYRIALNTSITHFKKEKRKGNQIPIDRVLLNKMDDMETIQEERLHILNHHIKQLDTVEKGLILLYLEGKNYEEIASITGFSHTNVGTRLSRIKQKLKSRIQK